ncbi:helix-turn-helix domain-containing protein [Streptomyces sp. NPDC056690]|uniref:helix-turn-helix domain-containing protein n=1 Tax=unclassified Streptomyces TaxID=2593676 RepID=UPI00362C4712
MTSGAGEVPAPTDRAEVDITSLLALPPGGAPASSDKPTPAVGTVICAERRTTVSSRKDQRGSHPSPREQTPRSVAANDAADSSGSDVVGLFTAEQAAQALQVPPSWLRKKAAAGSIRHTRIGRHLRFSTSDLRALIAQGQRGPDARNG